MDGGNPMMMLCEWSRSNIAYGRRLVDSGVDGARSGRDAFFSDTPLARFLGESTRNAIKPAAVAAGIGLLGSCLGQRHKSASKALAFGLLGFAAGFVAAATWETRHLTASVASGALKNIARVRDERWFEQNPIDYA
jgi:hypothetical protein